MALQISDPNKTRDGISSSRGSSQATWGACGCG